MPADRPQSLDETVALICAYPTNKQHSWNDWIKRSGYDRHRAEVTEERLAAYLDDHGALVGGWIGVSEDQRCSPAWGVERRGRKWVVFYYSGGKSDGDKTLEFDDPARACAAFIVRKLHRESAGLLGCVLVIVVLIAIALAAKFVFGVE